MNDPSGGYTIAYDNMGRLIGTATQYAFLPGKTYTSLYWYDAASNRTLMQAPDGSTNTYAYDTLSRLQTLTNSLTGQFGFGYDALSRRTSLTRPNGVATSYAYDALSHLLSVLHKNSGGTTLDGATYTYDNAGNRLTKANSLNGVTEGYTYDPIYELTQVVQGTTTTETYGYDFVGNRLSSLGVPTYSYNSSNELTSTSTGSYTYDNNGNTLTDPSGKSYTWDYEDRLISTIVPGTGTVTFKYDPFGKRIQKAFTQGSTTATTNYVYDGDNVLEALDNNGNLYSRYTQSLDIDEPLSELIAGTTSYYEADGLGSVSSVSSPSGVLANTYTYNSYGKVTASTGTTFNPFQYTAREFDSETGAYYYRARYYDPSVGRFFREDPIGFAGGFNFYAYVDNSPLNASDPTGLCGLCDNIPGHPKGADVDNNMAQSQQNGYSWWYQQVSAWNGAWDYKNYNGQSHPEWDNFGNFNYGATGCALGIPLNFLLRGAGYAKSKRLAKDPYGSPLGGFPYGNQPDKQGQITNGYNFCKKCMLLSNGGSR